MSSVIQALPVRLADIRELFLARGHLQYTGEPVSHLEHALQCAAQAEREGAGDALSEKVVGPPADSTAAAAVAGCACA